VGTSLPLNTLAQVRLKIQAYGNFARWSYFCNAFRTRLCLRPYAE